MLNNSFCVSQKKKKTWFSNNNMRVSRWSLDSDINRLSDICACFQKTEGAVLRVRDAAVHTDVSSHLLCWRTTPNKTFPKKTNVARERERRLTRAAQCNPDFLPEFLWCAVCFLVWVCPGVRGHGKERSTPVHSGKLS